MTRQRDPNRAKAADISTLEILSLIDAHDRDRSRPFAYEVLIARGLPEKVVYAKYQKLDRKGWIECGVSLRTGWLSPKGALELARRRKAAAEAQLAELELRQERGELVPIEHLYP